MDRLGRTDRRKIEPILGDVFPSMKGASSEDWHAFLNEQTGQSVAIDEDNASAFDKWRMALASQNIDTGFPTSEQASRLVARGKELKVLEDRRRADHAAALAALATEAPLVTAQDLIGK